MGLPMLQLIFILLFLARTHIKNITLDLTYNRSVLKLYTKHKYN